MTNKSPQIRARVNEVVKDLEKGKNRAELIPKYAKKWGIAETTIDRYLQDARGILKDRQKLAKKVADETLATETKKAVVEGVKTKTERILILQEQADAIIAELNANQTPSYFTINGRVQKVMKEISVTERAGMRKVLRELMAEISKIEGDYAPIKNANTDKNGNDIERLDMSKLSVSTLKELAKLDEE